MSGLRDITYSLTLSGFAIVSTCPLCTHKQYNILDKDKATKPPVCADGIIIKLQWHS